MTPFTTHRGRAAPLDRANVDTDAIIPKQYLKSVHRTGFGPNLFDDWRYLIPGDLQTDPSTRTLNPDFVLNQPHYKEASILITGANFGCGSSREHAVWALMDAGFRAVIAPGFADIFDSNAAKNGLLTLALPDPAVRNLIELASQKKSPEFIIDLEHQTVESGSEHYSFEMDPVRKHRLLEGLDDISLTLKHTDDIHAFEAQRRRDAPWLFDRFTG